VKDEHQIVSIGEVLEDLNSPTFVADNEPYLVGIYIGAVYETPKGRRVTGIDLREDTARGLLDAAREQAIDPQVMIGWLLDQVVRGKPTLSLVKDDGEGT
tara:strand:- start:97 stop:396 length:300 start_codon:yes stop_codon:yes gene_type:complete